MATQPQKDNLVKLLEGTIESNNETIVENKLSIIESQTIIDNFDPSCKGLDSRILFLTNSINTLKSQIVSLHSQAYAVGCGTTGGVVGVTTVYPDTVINSFYNISDSTYEDDQPYEITNQNLTSSVVGFGTFGIYKKNNNQVTGLGSAFENIGVCYVSRFPTCNSANCANFETQIAEKQNQVIALQAQINPLIESVNSLKTERIDYQIRRWSDLHTNKELLLENQRISTALNVLNSPENDSYI